MKKKFIAKKSKKRMRLKWLAFGAVAILSCIFTIKILAHFTLKTSQEDFLRFLLENQNAFVKNSRSNYSYFHQLMTKIIDLDITDPLSILNTNYKGMTSSDEIKEEPEATTTLKDPNPKEVEEPTIYIYNTHQTEEYKATFFAEYNVQPNVMMANYILKEELEKRGYQVVVEENSVAALRTSLGLNYAGSYQVTKQFMEQAKQKYPSLKYFIDLHRDSISYDKTTLQANDTSYAKILFIVGLENPNYQENLDFTTKIADGLNQKIDGLSKGIYKKEGAGVNGVYNQDFSNRTILVELGGMDNTIDEVYRTTLLLGEVLDEVIQND